MSSSPLISVIVPVYNTAPYLRQCLDSICNQTYTNLEIICINDGSTDHSAEILEEYSAMDSRVIVISQENGGQSAARNTGLDIAKGKWVTGVDSDDFLATYAIESAIKHTEDSDIDIVLLTIRGFSDRKPQNSIYSFYEKLKFSGKQKVSEEIIVNTPVFFCGKLWKKSLLEKNKLRFPVGLLAEDELFWNTTLPHCQYIYYENNVKDCYNYRKRESSSLAQLNSKNGDKGLTAIKIAELLCQYYVQNNIRQLWGYQADEPTFVEICKLEHLYKKTIQWTPAQYSDEFWSMFKSIVLRYNFIQSLSTQPTLSLFYYLHPNLIPALSQHFISRQEFELLLIANRLRRRYLILCLIIPFTLGIRKNKLTIEKRQIKKQLKWLRFRTRHVWKGFLGNRGIQAL